MIAGILLAAGESRRFGRPKLLERWHAQSLVVHAAQSLLDGGLTPVLVVVPPGPEITAALDGLDVRVVENPDPTRGIGSSVSLGVLALPAAATAALIGVADQPLVDEEVIRRLCHAFSRGRIVVPRYGAHLGNPPIFDRQFFPELAGLRGDRGGQAVATAHPEAVVECPFAERYGWDVDRPEDLTRLVRQKPNGGP